MAVRRIVSERNERVRRVRALVRSTRRRLQAGLMVVEGARLVREALTAVLPVEGYCTEAFAADDEGATLIRALEQRGVSVWMVSPSAMRAMADTATPQGILVLTPLPAVPVPADVTPFYLVADQLRDPGNLGTMLRAAWASGVTQVLLPPGTVDVTNPKVVRAGMGAHFHLPLRRTTWAEIRRIVAGSAIWLAEMGRGVPYDAVDWRGASTLVVGGETAGLSAEARSLHRARYVHIPMASGVESINAAMAATVLVFEAARQRRIADSTPSAR